MTSNTVRSRDAAMGKGIPAADPAPTRSARELRKQVAMLEELNHSLQLEAQRSAEQAGFRLAEVEHRLMNTFSTIQALAMQSAQANDTGAAFRATFGARLVALARSHEMLGSGFGSGAALAELVGRCLWPYDSAPGRITISGPVLELPAKVVPALGLAFHELTTNAVKYGSLSCPEGRVDVNWRLEARQKDQACSAVILWRERGGPPVAVPERAGFGSRLLSRGLAQDAGGTAHVEFARHGVDCQIRLPLPGAQASA